MTLLDRFRELPRASRWGLAAGGFLLFYFVVVEFALDRWNRWSAQADRQQAVLREWTEGSRARTDDETAVFNGRRVYGPAQFPGPDAERSQALRARVADVLKKHGVREYDERGRDLLLGNGPLAGAVGSGARVRRVVRDISFDCTPETMTDILADLEASPEVSAVSRVFVRKLTGSGTRNASGAARNVGVTMSVETWALAREGGAS